MRLFHGLLDSVNAKRSEVSTTPTPPALELRDVLAKNLRRKRLDASLTQKQLGALANVSRDYIGQIENSVANVSIDVLNLLAVHLDTSPLALLTPPKQNTL